jgi:DNA-binding beta-propeller fold protein YncE
VNPLSHEAWVTSLDLARVVRLSASGAALDTITGFGGPIGIAVDAGRGRVWVADAAANQVVALSPSGAVQFRIAGEPVPRAITVDAATGEAWVTLGGAGAVARLSPAGQEVQRVGGLSDPWGIALDDLDARAGLLAARRTAGRDAALPRVARPSLTRRPRVAPHARAQKL